MADPLIVELRAIIQEEMVHLRTDLCNLRADLCRDVGQEFLCTLNDTCATQLQIRKHTEEMVHLRADLLNLRADLRRNVRSENSCLPCEPSSALLTDLQELEESDPETTSHKECRIPQGQVKDPNHVKGKELSRQSTAWQPIEDLNGALPKEPKEQLRPLAFSQEPDSVIDAELPGQLDNADCITAPSSSPHQVMVSESNDGLGKTTSSKGLMASESNDGLGRTTSSKRFRQKRARKPRLQNAMGLVPDMEPERINDSGITKKMEDIVRHRWFEYCSTFAVFASAIFIGLASNYRATHLTEGTPTAYRIMDILFLLFFCAEIVIKLIVYRCHFFSIFGWAWNVFDLLLVIFQFLEEVASLFSYRSQASGVNIIRMCRILRAIRCIRIMKLTLFTSEFRLLVSCVIHCLSTFCWAASFLAIVIFVKGIYITDSVVSHRIECHETGADDEGLAEYYGSVLQSCLSLFQALTGGVDWNDLLAPLSFSSWHVFWFLIYIAFGILALMNLVTGLFVNTAIERAQVVKDLQRIFQARILFSAIDLDASQAITEEELMSHMSSQAIQEFLSHLDMEADDLRILFDIIDRDGGGSIDFEEFVNGLIHLSGAARSVDLLIMNHELRSYFGVAKNNAGENVWQPRWSRVGWQSEMERKL